MIRGLLLIFLIASAYIASAQLGEEERPTNNTAHKRVNHRKYQPKVKRYDKIYKKSTKKTLYGNPCAIDVTHKMGFEYVPLAQGRGKSSMGIFINNLFVNTKLIFTRSPAWKLILNKRLKDCRLKSGDGVG